MELPTKILSKEHEVILKFIDVLMKECQEMRKSKAVNRVFFQEAIGFIREYADQLHHAKEEEILFKELCSRENQEKMHCNPIEQMLFEHNLGRDFVRNMEESLNRNDWAKLAENAESYSRLLQEHIFKEDRIMYPLADSVLSPEAQRAILEEFRKVEGSELSRKVQKKYPRFLVLGGGVF